MAERSAAGPRPLRVLLATWGSLGDLHPFLNLGRALRQRGHDPVICAPEYYRANVAPTGLAFRPIRPVVPPLGPERDRLMRRITGPFLGLRFLWTKMIVPGARETFEDLLAIIDGEGGADCILSCTTTPGAAMASERRHIPNLTVVLQPINFFPPQDPPAPPQAPWLRPLLRRSPTGARAVRAAARAISAPWTRGIDALRAELGLPARGNYFFEGQFSPDGVLALFSRVLLRADATLPPRTTVAGFPFGDEVDPLDARLDAFLHGGEPPVLFTLGSAASSLAGSFYHAGLEAAQARGWRALLVGEERFLPRDLPRSAFAAAYVPYSQVMSRCAAAVVQGGIGTIAEALMAGTPLVVVPFGMDQPDNSERCLELGCAGRLWRRQLTPRRIARAVDAVLGSAAMREAAERVAARLAAEDGLASAIAAIERACAPVARAEHVAP